MALDPEARTLLDSMADMKSLEDMSLEDARAMNSIPTPDNLEPVGATEDRQIPGPAGEIPVRVYRPEGKAPFPLIVFFHGGGFVFCGLNTHDGLCRTLCRRVGAVVVSADYRLAPEAPFPAAPEDCYAATCWAAEHAAELEADAARMAVAGDSAGGNLAAVVSLMARDRGGPALCHQALLYPVTNYDFDTDSYRENAEGYFLTREGMRWCWNHYLQKDEDKENPLASPLRAADLAKLPAASVITAEYDPLRDEGEAYARRLEEAGVSTWLKRYKGTIHGFLSLPDFLPKKAEEGLSDVCKRLSAALH